MRPLSVFPRFRKDACPRWVTTVVKRCKVTNVTLFHVDLISEANLEESKCFTFLLKCFENDGDYSSSFVAARSFVNWLLTAAAMRMRCMVTTLLLKIV